MPRWPMLVIALCCVGCAGTRPAVGGAAAGPGAQAAAAPEGLAALAESWWQALMERSPTWATAVGDRRFDARLPDLSDASRKAFTARVEKLLADTRALNPAGLDTSARVTRDTLISTLERELDAQACRPWLWDVDQLTGPQVWLPQLPGYHSIRSEGDTTTLIARYRAIPAFLAAHRAQLERGLTEGFAAPRLIVERVISQLDRLASGAPSASPFVTQLRLPTGWHAGKLDGARAEFTRVVGETVQPALAAYRDFLRDVYLPRARESVGVDGLPGGAACYLALIRNQTGSKLGPDAIHDLGMAELSRVHAAMRDIAVAELTPPPPPPPPKQKKPKRKSRRSKKKAAEPTPAPAPPPIVGDPIRVYLARLEASPDQHPQDAEALLAFARGAVARAESKLPLAFRRLPRVPLEVRAIEPFRADESPAAYYYGAPDDRSRSAIYYVNTSHLEARGLFHQEALAFHEAVPGHHLQISVAAAASELPTFQRHLRHTAFTEGWALYAERLADELALYSSPASRFGALGYQAWRAARLVVDVGLHARGWTREQAIAFLVDNTTLSRHEASAEVERYIVWPGQALSYMLGRMHFDRLRRQAESELCVRFDLPRFHEEILRYGAVPPAALDGIVDRYIQAFYEQIIP
ncbi:MAG: DUF885 domain-containing protein [Myxococcota bacterium]